MDGRTLILVRASEKQPLVTMASEMHIEEVVAVKNGGHEVFFFGDSHLQDIIYLLIFEQKKIEEIDQLLKSGGGERRGQLIQARAGIQNDLVDLGVILMECIGDAMRGPEGEYPDSITVRVTQGFEEMILLLTPVTVPEMYTSDIKGIHEA